MEYVVEWVVKVKVKVDIVVGLLENLVDFYISVCLVNWYIYFCILVYKSF